MLSSITNTLRNDDTISIAVLPAFSKILVGDSQSTFRQTSSESSDRLYTDDSDANKKNFDIIQLEKLYQNNNLSLIL